MDFEWDPAKHAANLAKHGVDFADVAALFERFHYTQPSDRDGERRWIAIGDVHGRILTVVFTRREGRYRLISARRARHAEEAVYRAFLP